MVGRGAKLVAALAIAVGMVESGAVAPARLTDAGASPAVVVRVAGATLVNGAGQPLRLLGVDRSGTEYACVQGWGIFDGPADAASVAAMASWHIDAVRVPLNEDCWLGINGVDAAYGGANYQKAIEGYVALLHQYGLVAVLDLHWSAPGSTAATGQQVMADADHSISFWSQVAGAFADDPGVVFDLYNEPHDISWSCWLNGCTTPAGWQTAGMQQMLDAVRAAAATQPVMVAGLNWAGDLSQWLQYEPVDPLHQLVASVHVYDYSGCNTASCWNATIAPVAAQVPVVTGELGETDCGATFIGQYMDWADAHGVSYLGWSWDTADCASGPALISSYAGTPTAFGAGLQQHLAALAASSAPGRTTTPSTTTPARTPAPTTRTPTTQAPTTTRPASPGGAEAAGPPPTTVAPLHIAPPTSMAGARSAPASAGGRRAQHRRAARARCRRRHCSAARPGRLRHRSRRTPAVRSRHRTRRRRHRKGG